MAVVYIVGAIILILVSYIFWKEGDNTTGPPGPKGFWWLGNLFGQKMDYLHLVIEKWGQQYGDIFTGSLFGTRFVFLNDAGLIREALTSEEHGDWLNDRSPMFSAYYMFRNDDLIFGRCSKELMKLRKIFHNALKTYGDGVQQFENVIKKEINNFLERLENSREEDVDIKSYFKDSMSNVVSILLCGEPFEDDDPDIKIFWEFDNWGQKMAHPSIDNVLGMFPFLRFLPGKYGDTFRKTMRARELLLSRFYHEMKKSYCPGKTRGISDVLISIKENAESSGETWFTEDHVQALILDFVSAGLPATFESLAGMVLVLLHRRDIQLSIQSEIDRVIGKDRSPTMQDQSDMPYTQAAILEILRYMSVLPMAVAHFCSKDVVLSGYTIKKGSFVMPYLWGIHHNGDIWDNPWKMDPGRFLDGEGKLLPPEHRKRYALLPFGVGRRDCLGESFAKSRMFLYITNLLQRFSCLPSDAVTLPSPDPRHYQSGGLTVVPPDYVCRIQKR